MLKIIISGCNGHMGRVVESLCNTDPQVEVVAGFDVLKEICHIECYSRDMVIWVRLLDEFKLQVTTFRSNLTSHSIVIYILCQEDWC